MKRTVSAIFMAILLTSMLCSAFKIMPVGAVGTIYIRADGSIDPPMAPMQRNGDTYTLTGDIISDTNGIVIERGSIVVDGAGYTLSSGSGAGFSWNGINNVTVKCSRITDFSKGVEFDYSSGNSVVFNDIIDSSLYGIFFQYSSSSRIEGNNLTCSPDVGFHDGIYLHSSGQNYIMGNRIVHQPKAEKFCGIAVGWNSSRNSFIGNYITNAKYAITLGESHENAFIENNLTDNSQGIVIDSLSDNNSIYHNNFVGNSQQVVVLGGNPAEDWDNGYPSGGNYWSDYAGEDLRYGINQSEIGSDGIGDSAYAIVASKPDNYPLMRPYVPFENQTIYIRADGSVDPSGASIRREGDSYTLSGNITSNADGIVIERDNIVLDGAGFTIRGSGSGNCTSLINRNNVTIKNTNVETFHLCIYLYFSSANNVSGNSMANNPFGIYLHSSSNNSISGNSMANGWYGILLYFSSDYNSISGNNITDHSSVAIGIGSSSGSSSNNSITGNTVADSGFAIGLNNGFNNSISGNTITNNWYGISLGWSSNNRIQENTVANSDYYGINLYYSSDNRFYHNNFISNGAHYSENSANALDNGFEGNYWSDYNGDDANNDGIGDTPYIIDENNADHYPLMGTFNSYNVTYYTPPLVPHACNVIVISNSTISDFEAPIWIEHPEVIFLMFNVSGTGSSTGFCRVSFPTAMMSGTYHVSTDGTEIPFTLLPCSNSTHSYLYFNYAYSTQVIISTRALIPGDINQDGTVDIFDCVIIALAFGSKPGDPNWNPVADINNDGIVDIFDIVVVAVHFGETS
jgi:parallel beta-helix repeat protein